MTGGLRESMETELSSLVTQIMPRLPYGVIPNGLNPAKLLLESTLEDNDDLDPVIAMTRRGVRDSFLGSLAKIVHERMAEICSLTEPGEKRREALKQELRECLAGSFELFWGTLEALVRDPLPLDPKRPLDYLATNEDLALAFIQTAQESPQIDNLNQRIGEQCSRHPRRPINNFRGASIPNPIPLFEQFGLQCKEISGSHEHNVYGALMTALAELTQEATQDKQTAYFTPGARKAWLSVFDVLRKRYPSLRVYGTPHEYIAMLQDRNYCRVVDGDLEGESDEDELKISQRLLEAMSGDTLREQPVVFLSSVRRTGKRIDVNRIMGEIRREFPNVIFVVDAAQDHYMYPDADIVLYSKRFGGTGTGLIMLKKDSIPPEIQRAMTIQEGVNIQLLASTVAGLRSERQSVHFANRLQNLITTPGLWEFRGGGTYIDQQSSRIAQSIADDPYLSEHFEVEFSEEKPDVANPNLWKSSRVVTLRKKPHSSLDLEKLCQKIEQQDGLHLDWISPANEEEFKEIMALAGKPYTRDNCHHLCEMILDFQTTTKPTYFTEMIALPEVFNGAVPMSEDTFRRQIEYFTKSIERQSMIRLYIDLQMNSEDIDRLLSALSSAVTSSLTTSD